MKKHPWPVTVLINVISAILAFYLVMFAVFEWLPKFVHFINKF